MPTEIITGLWIGNTNDYNSNFIQNKNITSVITNLKQKNIKNIEFIYLPLNINYNKLNNEYINNLNGLFIDYIYDIIEYIHNKIINFKNVLICCKTCEQISPAIITIYLIKFGKIEPNKCIKYIKSKCGRAFPDEKSFFENAFYKLYNKYNN